MLFLSQSLVALPPIWFLYIYGDVVGAMGRPHDPEAILSGKASKATAFFRALCQTLDPLSRDRFRDWILERFWSGEEAGGYKVLLSVVTSSNASAMGGGDRPPAGGAKD